jgi:hypothetical protein
MVLLAHWICLNDSDFIIRDAFLNVRSTNIKQKKYNKICHTNKYGVVHRNIPLEYLISMRQKISNYDSLIYEGFHNSFKFFLDTISNS